MNNINLKRFVDVNILPKTNVGVNSIRDTVVLYSKENPSNGTKDETYTNLYDFINREGGVEDLSETAKYVQVFFNNGGNKLRVIYNKINVTLDDIKKLPNEQIVVTSTMDYSALKTVAKNMNLDKSIYGINSKILVACTNQDDEESISNLAVKYSNVKGAEMTIAAYLSRIDIYGYNTVFDYAFTIENIDFEDIDDTTFGNLDLHNMNVDLYIANNTRNIGGNLKDGKDITNSFMLIVLHQTLTDRLLQLLSNKIKGSQGIAAIQSTLSQELYRYVRNGFLSTDKIYNDETLYKQDAFGNKYNIISKGTPLSKGYKITILPLSSLSDQDKKERKAPDIYIIVADSYGIRKITINGEVI